MIQWVRQFADQATRRVPGQPGVGVQSNDVANSGRNLRGTPIDALKVRIGRSSQEAIQFVKLPAFAFPSHPLRLHLAPDPAAVEQQEAFAC